MTDVPFYDSQEMYKMQQRKEISIQRKAGVFTRLIMAVVPDGDRFRIYKPFSYYWQNRQTGEVLKITVPVGFPTDLASIPPVVRLIIAKLGRYNEPAVIHDFLYRKRMIVTDALVFTISRKVADIIFLGGMEDKGVVIWKRYLMYWGVRLFGWIAWRKR